MYKTLFLTVALITALPAVCVKTPGVYGDFTLDQLANNATSPSTPITPITPTTPITQPVTPEARQLRREARQQQLRESSDPYRRKMKITNFLGTSTSENDPANEMRKALMIIDATDKLGINSPDFALLSTTEQRARKHMLMALTINIADQLNN